MFILLAAGEPAGETSISVNTGGWNLNSKLTNGMVVSLGPSTSTLSGSAGKSEEFSVQTVGTNYFTILGTTSYYYNEADTISFYKNVWLFNDYDGTDGTSGALYELNPRTGCSVVGKRRGGEFQGILACTFYDVSNVDPSWGNAIAYIKSTNMIFIAPVSAGYTLTSYGSMVMDNIESDLATVIPIHDVTIEGNNVYRLQLKATYGTKTVPFTNYQYQLSTLQKFITSISLKASPAILPADGTQLSTITAIVKDQFNLPITGVPVSFTREPPTEGEILQPNPDYSDDLGVASTYYQAGVNAAEIVITATASQADV